MGCLGWSAEQALDTPLPWIYLALRSHWSKVRFMLGLPEPPAPTTSGEIDRAAVARKTAALLRGLANRKRVKHG